MAAAKDILAKGIDPARFKPGRDFGPGFYLTTNLNQARQWSMRRSKTLGDVPVVVRYALERNSAATLESIWFVRHRPDDCDFWTLVRDCRSGALPHNRLGLQAAYDLVVGPVALLWDNPPLKVMSDSDQLSFHTDKALALLRNPAIVP